MAVTLYADQQTLLQPPGINWDKNRMMLSWHANNSGDHIDYWLEISPQADFEILHDSVFLNRYATQLSIEHTGYYARISARTGDQIAYSDIKHLERYAPMSLTDKLIAGLWLLIILAL